MGFFSDNVRSSNGGGGGKSWYVARDENRAFAKKGKIIGALVQTDHKIGKDYTADLTITLKLDIGASFDKEITIAGNWTRVKTAHGLGPVTDKGTTFKILDVFAEFGVTGEQLDATAKAFGVDVEAEPADWDLDGYARAMQQCTDTLIGQDAVYVDYLHNVVEGKAKTYSWNDKVWAAPEEEEEVAKTGERMIATFQKRHAETGYPKNYRPDLNDQVGGSAGGDGAVSVAETTATTDLW